MKTRPAFTIALAAALLPLPSLSQDTPPPRVGIRRAVKNGTDPDAQKVKATPVKTTVDKLLDLPIPPEFQSNEPDPELDTHRVEPIETTIWEIDAEVVAHQLMPDGDFRVVLQGASGRKIVVELPDPKIAGPKSRWAKEIAEVRKQFEERFHPQKEEQQARGAIRLQGIGHFGRLLRRATPGNLSSLRLQPVVKLEILPEKPARKPGEPPKK